MMPKIRIPFHEAGEREPVAELLINLDRFRNMLNELENRMAHVNIDIEYIPFIHAMERTVDDDEEV